MSRSDLEQILVRSAFGLEVEGREAAQLLADMLSGKQPEIDTSELTVDRYDHRFG